MGAVRSSAVGMDKATKKVLLRANGLRVADWVVSQAQRMARVPGGDRGTTRS